MVAFLKKLRTAEGGEESTEEQMQAQNLWYLRKESMNESSKRSSMMTLVQRVTVTGVSWTGQS